MRLRTLLRFLSFAAIIIFFASCKKTNEQGKMIPADASVVVLMNGESLSGKLPWDEIKGNVLFQKIYGDTSVPSFIKGVLDNPDNSGINIKSNLIFFMKKDSLGSLIGIEGSVKDAAKFKSFNQLASKGGSETEKDGVSYISHSPICVGWNKDKFVYVFNSPDFGFKGPGNFGGMVQVDRSRDIVAACKSIFDLKEKTSLSSNEKFTDLVKKEGDIHFWLNSEQLYKGMAGIPAMSMFKLDKLYEGNITTATANFENGKITIDYKTYTGKLLDDLLKKSGGGSIDEKMIKRLPSKDVAAILAIHFKPEGLQELLKTMGMDGLANMGLSSIGITLDDFIKANKGDLLIAVTDIKNSADSMHFPGPGGKDTAFVSNATHPEFLFSVSIGDKEAFNKLITAAKKIMGEKMGNPASLPPGIAYNMNTDYFAIGNSKTNIDSYISGNNNNSYDFLSHLAGNPIGGYVNLQYIMKAMGSQMTKDSSSRIAYDASVKMWDNIYITGGKYSGGSMTYNVEINLMDKSSNSLKQLNQYLGKIGALIDEKKKKQDVADVTMEEIKDKNDAPKVPVKEDK